MTDADPKPATPSAESQDDPPRSHRLALTGIVVALCVAIDLWSKQWAWNNLRAVDGVDPEVARRGIPVIEHVFYLKFGFNTGSAFSFLADASWARVFFIVISFVALAYMAWLAWKMPTRHRYGFIAVGMIAGGTIGNLHDRFLRTMEVWVDGERIEKHGVIDFLQFFWDWEGQRYWPIFNAADSALVCGVALLLIYIRLHGGQDEKAAAEHDEADEDDDSEDEEAQSNAEDGDEDDGSEPEPESESESEARSESQPEAESPRTPA